MFKKTFLFSIGILVTMCTKKPVDYVKLSGSIITDSSIDSVQLITKNRIKTITVTNREFSDTIHADGEFAKLVIQNQNTILFLKNSFDVNITYNTKNQDIQFSGTGAKTNNYLSQRQQRVDEIIKEREGLMILDKKNFLEKIQSFESELTSLRTKAHPLDSIVNITEINNLTYFVNSIKETYKRRNNIESFNLSKGDKSPEFNNYISYNGGTKSLKDYLGNYVYIDIWATWCNPCKQEIPFLKQLEEKYRNKNIKFVSISVDAPSKEQVWRGFVEQQNLKGEQLFANGDQQFTQDFEVRGIPRFIFLNPKGEIELLNAPRPSSGQMKKLFDKI